jgi:uncharacterized protein DUF4416
MAGPPPIDPVKTIAAVLFREDEALAEALARLRERFGEIDFEGPDHDFAATDYYEAELGKGLKRRIFSFHALAASEDLIELKLAAGAIEEATRGPAGRRVNIDIGYLDVHKLVLASRKPGAQKVHLGQGIWADLVLRYSKGRFHPFEWSFLDFKDGTYHRDLLRIREKYKAQLGRLTP